MKTSKIAPVVAGTAALMIVLRFIPMLIRVAVMLAGLALIGFLLWFVLTRWGKPKTSTKTGPVTSKKNDDNVVWIDTSYEDDE